VDPTSANIVGDVFDIVCDVQDIIDDTPNIADDIFDVVDDVFDIVDDTPNIADDIFDVVDDVFDIVDDISDLVKDSSTFIIFGASVYSYFPGSIESVRREKRQRSAIKKTEKIFDHFHVPSLIGAALNR
jgi:hypothetical protein